jgi:transcriptional regulator with XRE-family HTH domain
MAQIVPVQCFLARTALGWSARKLASVAGVSANTVANFEGGGVLRATTIEAIQDAFERAGIVFVGADDGGPGARLSKIRRM